MPEPFVGLPYVPIWLLNFNIAKQRGAFESERSDLLLVLNAVRSGLRCDYSAPNGRLECAVRLSRLFVLITKMFPAARNLRFRLGFAGASGTLAISGVGIAFLAALIAEEGQAMTLAERFLVQAAECDRMSKISHDQTNKMLWRGLADRWRQCAELECKNATKQRSRRARPTQKARLH